MRPFHAESLLIMKYFLKQIRQSRLTHTLSSLIADDDAHLKRTVYYLIDCADVKRKVVSVLGVTELMHVC